MSQFGDLWVDEPDASARIDAMTPPDLREHLAYFIEHGYTIFPGVVSEALIDEVVRDTRQLFEHPERYVLKNAVDNPKAYVDPVALKLKEFRKGDRVSDVYAVSAAARKAIANDLVARFLNVVFQEAPIAMQSISFEYGSQQAIHQDTAYVISKRPTELAASWLALEDVAEGTGELIFYPGSHRFKDFLFSNQTKSWQPQRDGQQQHTVFLDQLHGQAKELGLHVERFLPKKGDILVWHADLAHGGARLKLPDATRRSLVAHFCPLSVKPNYMTRLGKDYYEYKFSEEMYFTSGHYDLKGLLTQDYPNIVFDGGVTAARPPAKVAATA